MKLSAFYFVMTLIALSGLASANQPDLRTQILAMDNKLFTAFNARDLETTKAIFDRDLEFYHDTGGVPDYDQAVENTKNLFDRNTDLKRELLADKTEIYPIKDFGAIQIGEHQFCHTENNKQDCGTFKFVHIWKNTDNHWTLVRVVSYAH